MEALGTPDLLHEFNVQLMVYLGARQPSFLGELVPRRTW